MPYALTDDGVNLYYESTGAGEPLIFVHEFAGDHRSWEPQIRNFGRRYQCVAYNARGYPPSDVPEEETSYSQDRAQLDILSILDHCRFEKAHICGLSMGGFAVLHFGLHHPERVLSMVVSGCGYGAEKNMQEQFRAEAEATAGFIKENSMDAFAEKYAEGPTRVQFKNKDPRGWKEFRNQLAEHSTIGSALTMNGVQARRPSLFDLEEKLKQLTVPTLILNGDEDYPCLIPGIYLKRMIRSSALITLANSGHTINLESTEDFNRAVDQFLTQVHSGQWSVRLVLNKEGSSILGMKNGES